MTHRPHSKRKTIIASAIHSYPNAKLALGLSRTTPASIRGGHLTQVGHVKVATGLLNERHHTGH
jgi:hypothetical protein